MLLRSLCVVALVIPLSVNAQTSQPPTEAVVAPAPSGRTGATAADETPSVVAENQPARPGEVTVPRASLLERVTLFGYAKVGFTYFVPRPETDALVGSRSGFRLLNARLGVAIAATDTLDVVASVDGSAAQRNELDPLAGSRIVALRDAYIEWRPSTYFEMRAGQFKPPFNAETLLTDSALPFITRSILSEGVLPPEGFREERLSLDRQVGVQLASRRIGSGLLGLRYAAAVVNGNGPNRLDNDNSSVTPVARLALEVGEWLVIGANGYYDEATVGELPTRLGEKRLGYGADVGLRVANLTVLAVAVLQNTEFAEGLPEDQAMGAMGSVHYHHVGTGLEGGARYAWYEPSDLQEDDVLGELTLMLGYRVAGLPLRLLAQYTLRREDIEIDNNSVDALLQVTF